MKHLLHGGEMGEIEFSTGIVKNKLKKPKKVALQWNM